MENLKLNKKEFILDIVIIFIGCLIASIGINFFLANAKLLSGGVAGIALIIEYLTGFQTGYTTFLINIPLFILSYKKLSKRFTLYSIIGATSLSITLVLTSNISYILNINDVLLYCIFGGMLTGLGFGIVFLRNGSTGGIDIVNIIIRQKYPNLNIGTISLGINAIVVLLGAFFLDLPKALYTLICILIQGMVLNYVIKGFTSKKLMLILTEKEDQVISYIIKDLHRGVTTLKAHGEFTNCDRRMLYCLVTNRQYVELRTAILNVDPKTFISVLDVSEVKGKGFTNL